MKHRVHYQDEQERKGRKRDLKLEPFAFSCSSTIGQKKPFWKAKNANEISWIDSSS